MNEILGKNKKMKEYLKGTLLLLIGVILGVVVGTLGVQHHNKNRNNKYLHIKLLNEIRMNLKQQKMYELSKNFAPFEVDVWSEFVGSSAYYQLSKEVQLALDFLYTSLKTTNKYYKNIVVVESGTKMSTIILQILKQYNEYLVKEKIITEREIL